MLRRVLRGCVHRRLARPVRLADWRYAHLAYSPDLDDACSDATGACLLKVWRATPDQFVTCAFKTLAGVVEAFADSTVVSGVLSMRSAVVVWRHDEFEQITKLMGEFR